MIFSQWHKSSTAAGLKAACRAVAHFKKDPAWPPPRGTASRAFSVPSGRTTMMRSLPPLSADPPSFPNLSFPHRNENIWLHIYSSSTSTSIFGSVYYCSNCLIATRAACSCFRQTEVKVPEWFVALANKTELLLAAKFTDKSIMHPNSEAFFFLSDTCRIQHEVVITIHGSCPAAYLSFSICMTACMMQTRETLNPTSRLSQRWMLEQIGGSSQQYGQHFTFSFITSTNRQLRIACTAPRQRFWS